MATTDFPQVVTVSYTVTARHYVAIPDWRPALLNELFHSVKERHRLKKIDREFVQVYFHKAKVPHATGKRRVGVIVHWPWLNTPDEDSVWKSLYDALVINRYLMDDRAEFVCHSEPIFPHSWTKETIITLEDLG
jgi:hypothetical protein